MSSWKLVRNILLYLDLRDWHTYMNTWTLLQRNLGSLSKQSNHNGLLDDNILIKKKW